MTLFFQLRLWWRRSSSGSKLGATLAAMAAVALVAWVLVPTNDDAQDVAALPPSADVATTGAPGATLAPGATTGDAGGAGSGTSTSGTGSAAATGAAIPGGATSGPAASGATSTGGDGGTGRLEGGATGGSTSPSCPPTPSGSRGVTARTILLDFALLDLAGPIGNNAVGQVSAQDSQRLIESMIGDINARGGVACRTITAKFYRGNPISADSVRAACLAIVQDRPAIAVDVGGLVYANAYNCPAQQKVPTIASANLLKSEIDRFFPYLAGPAGDYDTSMRTAVAGLQAKGFFDPAKGFKKLGILADECAPEIPRQFEALVRGIGITQISRYTFACPSNGFASPGEMAQAAAQHRLDGATHVVPLTGSGSFNPYAGAAERQGYRPKYGITDYQAIFITAASNLKPDQSNFDGAVGVTLGTFGANTTPGLAPDPGTVRCQAAIRKAGLPPAAVYNGLGGMCNYVWMAEAMLRNATTLAPEGILLNVFRAGKLQFSYPLPDSTFRAPRKVTGGDTWTYAQYRRACSCWHVLDRGKPSVRAQ